MAAIGRFTFIPRTIQGSQVGASAALPSGSPNYSLYYNVQDGMALTNSLGYTSGQGEGKKVGIIAYDYINARWSFLSVVGGMFNAHANTTWQNDAQQIKDFMSTLGTPNLTDEAGNDIPYPASFVGTVG